MTDLSLTFHVANCFQKKFADLTLKKDLVFIVKSFNNKKLIEKKVKFFLFSVQLCNE